MAGAWGPKLNGVKIGVFWDGVAVASDGSTAKLTNPHVSIDRDQNISDTANTLTVSGSAVKPTNYGSENASGSGSATVKTCTALTVGLTYGKATNVTFSAAWKDIGYAHGTLTASQTITFPARAYVIPSAPGSFKVTRNTDTKHTLTWTNNVSTAAPYTTTKLERWDKLSNVWTALDAKLTATSVSFIDTTTVADRLYQWRLTVTNSSGSRTVTSAQLATTPLAPVNLTVTKSGNTMSLIWNNKTLLTAPNVVTEVWCSVAGAAYTLIATQAAGVASYTHPNINVNASYQYQIRTVSTPGPLYSAYLVSPLISFLAAPKPPTLYTTPAWDFTAAFPISWVHNPVDGTIQTAAEVQYRPVGGDELSWVTRSFTTETGWLMPANTLANAVTYEFRARTKGDHVNFGAYTNPTQLVTGSKAPTAAITSPVDGVPYGSGNFVVEFTYSDPDATNISAWRVTLTRMTDSQVVYDYTRTLSTTDTAFSYTVPYMLENNLSYKISVYVRDGASMWSPAATVTVPVSFALPPEALVDAFLNECSGKVEVHIANYPPGPGEVDATYQNVDRWDARKKKWIPVKTNVPVTNSLKFGVDIYNYATNPGFEAYGGAVEIQRNLILNPRMRTTATWVQQGSGVLMTANADTSMTVATSGIAANEGVLSGPTGTAAAPIVAANGVHYEVQVRGDVGALLALQVTYYLSNGGSLGATRQNFTADGTWQRQVYEVATAPAGATFVQVGVVTQGTRATTFYLLKPLLEKLPTPGLYYDGYTSTMGDVTASWTGVENASASILSIQVPTGSALPTADYYVMSSAGPVASGARAARVYRRVVVGGAADPVWVQVASGLPNTAGQHYTLLFTTRTADVGGTVPGSFRVVDASTVQLLAIGTGTTHDQEQLRVEYVGNGNGTIRLQATIPGASGGQSAWVDNLGVFLAPYDDVWFSGASKAQGIMRYSWTGAKEASTSVAAQYGLDTLVLTDPLPNLNQEIRYRVTTRSATPTYNIGDPVVIPVWESCFSYLNGGDEFELVAKFSGSPSLTQEVGREKALYTFAGRESPLEYIGDTRRRSYAVAGLALSIQHADFCDQGCDGKGMVDMVEAWELMADLPAPLCYRDMRGVHRFGSISDISVDYETSTPFANVSFTFTEIDYTPEG